MSQTEQPAPSIQTQAIIAEGLTRAFGERIAVDHVSFEVEQGEVFGFLGSNGAGKSTTARMLTGFVRPTSGRACIAGLDVAKHPSAARRLIGVVPEEEIWATPDSLLNLAGQFYPWKARKLLAPEWVRVCSQIILLTVRVIQKQRRLLHSSLERSKSTWNCYGRTMVQGQTFC